MDERMPMPKEPHRSILWTRRRIVVAGLAATVGAGWPAIGRAQHLNSRGPTTQDAVTPQDIDRRLDERAAGIRQVAPQGADRYVIFDLSYPLDEDEYRAVGKTALVLLVAVSRNSDELPLRRVFTTAGKQEVALRRLGSRRSELGPKSLARVVVGRYREDAFWLAPVGPLLAESMLLCDFARNRSGFVINHEPFDPPDFVVADRARETAEAPQAAAVKAFVEREYPGFGLVE
jgi:hypothetical protein